MLLDILQLPFNFASDATAYVSHPRGKTNPLYPLATLRTIADWVPVHFLSRELHKQIDYYGDLISYSHHLRDERNFERWQDETENQLLQRMANVCGPAHLEALSLTDVIGCRPARI